MIEEIIEMIEIEKIIVDLIEIEIEIKIMKIRVNKNKLI